MSIQIEMTGKEDREGPWKMAICGYGGSGKSLFGSTAPNPLFVFFAESPRIKSIAMRHVPHVKLLNKYEQGSLSLSVQDQVHGLALSLQLTEGHDFDTLVIDTGNELFQAMKEARRAQNGGEFGPGDWGWIADAYREVITGLVDLPMNVIVLFHIKTAQEGDIMFRELMLQGASKDEAPTWFDVVGVLENYEVITEDGGTSTKRVLLTNASRMYPWAKDHSGALPRPFEISDNFVGDYDRMMEYLTAEEEAAVEGQEHTVLGVVPLSVSAAVKTGAPVPTPEQLDMKKKEPNAEPDVEPEAGIQEPGEGTKGGDQGTTGDPEPEVQLSVVPDPEPDEGSDVSEVGPEPAEAEPAEAADGEAEDEPDSEEAEVTEEEATAALEEELGAEQVFVCADCNEEIEDENVRELSRIRFQTYLCRPHYLERLRK